MAYDVFICHAEPNRAIANRVCGKLEGNGISCWIAPRDIPPGEKWDHAIAEALPQCRILVIIFSAYANDSDYCINEVGIAFEGKKEIIPFRIDNTVPSGAMILYLRNRQWIDAQEPHLENELDRLVKRVKERLKKESVSEKPSEEQEVGEIYKETKAREKPSKTWMWAGSSVLVVAVAVVLLLVMKPWGGGDATQPPSTPATTAAVPTTTTPPATTESMTTPPTTEPTTTEPTTTEPTQTAVLPAEPYGTIKIASATFNNEAMDPSVISESWVRALYDPLITYDEAGNYIGAVAESWTISPDGNTWTFNIRQGIKFHNGDPLTAEDVKFSVDRFGDTTQSTNPWSFFLSTDSNKVSSAVIDDYTFQYVTEHPEPSLLVPFSYVHIIPKDYFERVGQDYFRAHPVGSGPWKFVEHIWDASFKMEANTDYWGEVPHFQYVIDLLVTDEAEQIDMLKRGEIDYISVSHENIPELQNSGYRTVEVGLPIINSISFQGTWLESAGPTHSLLVRQAIYYAINRQEICDTYYHGNAVPGGQWFMHPGCWGWTDELVADIYDPNRAIALLEQAGYPDSFSDPTIHIYYNDNTQTAILQILQGYWNAIGIQVELELFDPGEYWSLMFNLEEMTESDPNVGWGFQWVFSSTFNSIYHAQNLYCSGGAHNTSNDATADSLYNQAFNELDPTLALEYYQDFLLYARSMYINIGICQILPLKVVSSNLGEFTTNTHLDIYEALAGIQHPD
jgi:peptide/nickel transport system substrate-binding protein